MDVESSYSPHKFTVNCSSTDDPENATQASDPIYSEVLKKVEVAVSSDILSPRMN